MKNAADLLRYSGDEAESLSPPWVLSLIILSTFLCLLFATGFSYVNDEDEARRTQSAAAHLSSEEALDFKTERPQFRRALALARPSANSVSEIEFPTKQVAANQAPAVEARSSTVQNRSEHDQSANQDLKLDFAQADGVPREPMTFQQISALGAGGLKPRYQSQDSAPPPVPEKVTPPNQALGAGEKKRAEQVSTVGQNKAPQNGGVDSAITLQTAIRLPQWRKNAAAANGPASDSMVAIVIDDLGLNRKGTKRILEMKGPYTLSFISYAEGLSPMLRTAKHNGHELMLHLPMEPFDGRKNAGPKALMTGHSPWEIKLLMEWGLSRVQGIVGINNHMGSRFTSRSEGMAVVMRYLRESGLFYLDSRTASSKVSEETAEAAGVPFLGRDIFLDHGKPDKSGVLANLRDLEAIARRRGYAIAIAHPYSETLEALAEWRDSIGNGVRLVPITAILRQRLRRAEAKAPTMPNAEFGG